MKICNYKITSSLGIFNRLGILKDGFVIDVNYVWNAYYETLGNYDPSVKANQFAPSSLATFLKINGNAIEKLKETQDLFDKFNQNGISNTKDLHPLSLKTDSLEFGCPLDKISSYRDFYIHEKHVKKGFEKRNEEIPKAWFEIPAYYKGSTSGFIGNNDEVLWPSYTDILDYELELGMVVANDGFNISEKDAHRNIFGYTILNDISARDIQKKEMSVRLGPAKGKDFCSVMGPVITTADEFNFEEPNLLMKATINGDLWSEGHSGDGHYTWAQMISHVAKDEWLRAGDFFGSGTVGTGCGLEIDKWIKPGDTIELYVEKIGTLTNTIGKKQG